jgi:hypothetical protein
LYTGLVAVDRCIAEIDTSSSSYTRALCGCLVLLSLLKLCIQRTAREYATMFLVTMSLNGLCVSNYQIPTTTPSIILSSPSLFLRTSPGLTSTPLLPVPSHLNSYMSGCPNSHILHSSASAMMRVRSSSLCWSLDVGFAQGKNVSEKCAAAWRPAHCTWRDRRGFEWE